jgi:hypothetical protein
MLMRTIAFGYNRDWRSGDVPERIGPLRLTKRSTRAAGWTLVDAKLFGGGRVTANVMRLTQIQHSKRCASTIDHRRHGHRNQDKDAKSRTAKFGRNISGSPERLCTIRIAQHTTDRATTTDRGIRCS